MVCTKCGTRNVRRPVCFHCSIGIKTTSIEYKPPKPIVKPPDYQMSDERYAMGVVWGKFKERI